MKKRVSRFARATGLFDGRRRYVVATLLWLCYLTGSVPPHGAIAHALLYPRFLLCSPDLYLNVRGLFGRRDDGPSDGPLAVDEMDHDFTRFGAAVRPYLVLLAAVFVIAFLVSGLVAPFDVRWLRWAVALAALSASMYLKDLDPQLAAREHEAGQASSLVLQQLSEMRISRNTNVWCSRAISLFTRWNAGRVLSRLDTCIRQ